MGFLDRLFGTDDSARQVPPVPLNTANPASAAGRPGLTPPSAGGAPQAPTADETAIERYRYLLRTAPPQTIEQVHAEAFGRLTEAQRQQVLADLAATLPPSERPATDDPSVMARAATRAEVMNPGFMERSFGNGAPGGQNRQGPSFGSMVGGSLLGTVAGYVIGSAIVSSFMAPAFAYDQGYTDGVDASAESADAGAGSDAGASGGDVGSDFGGGFDGGGFDFGGF